MSAEAAEAAAQELRHLTTCHCEGAWTMRGRHAPECVSEYREDVEVLVDHLTPHEVDVPSRTMAFASKAVAAGWAVSVITRRGPELDNEGQPKRESVLVKDTREESDGKSKRVFGAVRVVDVVAVRCRRGGDALTAVWAGGAFDFAVRPVALWRKLTSTEALFHIQHSKTLPCRWLPSSRGASWEICENHAEERSAP